MEIVLSGTLVTHTKSAKYGLYGVNSTVFYEKLPHLISLWQSRIWAHKWPRFWPKLANWIRALVVMWVCQVTDWCFLWRRYILFFQQDNVFLIQIWMLNQVEKLMELMHWWLMSFAWKMWQPDKKQSIIWSKSLTAPQITNRKKMLQLKVIKIRGKLLEGPGGIPIEKVYR